MTKIHYPQSDPKAYELIQAAVSSISPRWTCLLPEMNIFILPKAFVYYSKLVNLCEGEGNAEKMQIVSSMDINPATIYAHYHKLSRKNNEYRFQKELLETFALLIWFNNPPLAQAAVLAARGIGGNSEILSLMEFRKSFPKFFLMPEVFESKYPDAQEFMCNLDQLLSQGFCYGAMPSC